MVQVLQVEEARHCPDPVLNAMQLDMWVRSGRWQEIAAMLERWFDRAAEGRMDMQTARAYVIFLYVRMAAGVTKDHIQDYIRGVEALEKMKTLHSLKAFLLGTVEKRLHMFKPLARRPYNSIVMRMKQIVEDNIGNPILSLQWVASEILFMNADYIGKQFKRETGLTFTQYVAKMRVQRAIDHIAMSDKVKVLELAEMLGYGNNPHYFSRVFKQQTGLTPSEMMGWIHAGKEQKKVCFLPEDV
jgi:two-component system response regulator YesN